jgi:hypothetical protein
MVHLFRSIGRLGIANGSFTLFGELEAAGLWSGNAPSGGLSAIGALQIADVFFEEVKAGGSSSFYRYPTGIGSGNAEVSGLSIVHNLLIDGGLFHSVSGIGTGGSSDPGSVSAVDNLKIDGGTFLSVVGSWFTAGIGSGFAASGSESRIGNLKIANGSFALTASLYASGIGSGYADGGYSNDSSGAYCPSASVIVNMTSENGSFMVSSVQLQVAVVLALDLD